MRNLKTMLMCLVTLFAMSCTMSAKTEPKDQGSKDTGKEKNSRVVMLTKAEFLKKVFNFEKNASEWVYEGQKPCIIDFYADWCGPCKKVAPILAELSEVYKDDIIIYKIDVDAEQELAAAFGIQSIPTILFVPQKGTPQMAQGALPKAEFIKQIDEFLLGK